MMGLGFVIGAIAMLAIGSRVRTYNTSTCCAALSVGARNKLAGYAGPFEGLTSGLLDALGITPHIPALLDALGAPIDA